MANINDIILESFLSLPDKLKRKHAGSGWGKTIGNIVGSFGGPAGAITGTTIGHYAGKASVDNPEKELDTKSKSQRVGALLDRGISLRIAAGSLASAGTGAVASHLAGLDPDKSTAVSVLSGAGGHLLTGMHDRWKTAGKMGYGGFGKSMAALTPLAGLTTPKSQKK